MIHSHCKLFIASILLQLFQKVEEELAVETICYGSPKYSKIRATWREVNTGTKGDFAETFGAIEGRLPGCKGVRTPRFTGRKEGLSLL